MTRAAPLAALLCALLWAPAWAQAPAPVEPPAPGQGAAGAGPHACVHAPHCVFYDDRYHIDCGSRGGPGCRKDNGRCAAWRDGFAPDCRQAKPAPAL